MTLKRADLSDTDLTRPHLSGADLSHAILSGAEVIEANLSGSNLSKSVLSEAFLDGANLSLADLSGARLWHTIFANTDLSEVSGLETANHSGPSEISINTIYKSAGRIPEVFLRGCGVPDDMITYVVRKIGRAKVIQFYSAFISYSTKDEEFVKRLHADLQAEHVRVWFAPEELKIGGQIRSGIDKAIRVYDKLLLILSKNSIKSDWVEKEVEAAFEKERKNKRIVLFPVRIDDAVMNSRRAWAADIRRQRNIGNFAEWTNHDAYQKAFDRLLRDLRAEPEKMGA